MKPVDRRAQEQTQPTPSPLMTQNGGAGMMMHQMYPNGYQIHPSAGNPTAPGMVPNVTSPPPNMMHPNGQLMQPVYHHGYASGSSTPVHTRSPARSRKAMGMESSAAWLGQQNPHLVYPGMPGSPHASRAPSVMSMMSTMTGFNDDAVSVMSAGGGVNLVEMKPATSQQVENIDPVRMGAMIEEARNLAMRLTQSDHSVQTAITLSKLLKNAHPGQFPKEILEWFLSASITALCGVESLHLDVSQTYEFLSTMFFILHYLVSSSSQMRERFFEIAHSNGSYGTVLRIVRQSLAIEDYAGGKVFRTALSFLTVLIRKEQIQSQYSMELERMIVSDEKLFNTMFVQMSNKHLGTAVEFVCRMLTFGARRKFREKISEDKVRFLLHGKERHEGMLSRFIRKMDATTVHNTLLIIELLVRNDPRQTPHEVEIQKWFIEQNIFFLLSNCVVMSMDRPGDSRLIDTSLVIFATLTGSEYISDDVARSIAILMAQLCARPDEVMKGLKIQNSIMHTLYILSKTRMGIRQLLVQSAAFNYACHLVRTYANAQKIGVTGKFDLLETSLVFCLLQLRLQFASEDAARLWTEGGEMTQLTSLFFDPSFVSCLLNILVAGSDLLKTRAIQVIVAGLSLPTKRFATVLFKTYDEVNHESIVAAVFNTIDAAMRSDKPSVAFIQSSSDLLLLLIEESSTRFDLTLAARSSTSHFPLNILFHPSLDVVLKAEYDNVVRKILHVCKSLIDDPELQQSWSQYRDQFSNLSVCGSHAVAQIAAEILGMLGVERESDYSMQFANSFL